MKWNNLMVGVVIGMLIGAASASASGAWQTVKDFVQADPVYQHGYIQGMADTLTLVVNQTTDETGSAKGDVAETVEFLAHQSTCLDRHQQAKAIDYRRWALGQLDIDGMKYSSDMVPSSLIGSACR